MVTPDGMATMAAERKHMREMRHLDRQPSPPWELAALDKDGNELYRTNSFDTREEAQAEADVFEAPDEVDRFEPRRKD